ncbi:hypothetical protein Tco_0137802 [Tanacetum coccineum]
MPGAWFSRNNAKYCSMVRVSTSTPVIVLADIESILYADPSLEINNVKVKLIGLHECINSVPIPTRTLDLSSREFSTTKEKKYYRVRSRLVLILEKESSVEGLIATIQRFRFEESLAGFAAALAVLIYGASQSRNTVRVNRGTISNILVSKLEFLIGSSQVTYQELVWMLAQAGFLFSVDSLVLGIVLAKSQG